MQGEGCRGEGCMGGLQGGCRGEGDLRTCRDVRQVRLGEDDHLARVRGRVRSRVRVEVRVGVRVRVGARGTG